METKKTTGKKESAAPERPRSLVTGSCGFIGTSMIETLHRAGHEIIATDLQEAYEKDDLKKGRFGSVLKKLDIRFIPSDMRNSETLRELPGDVDYIFHIASVFSYSAPWEVLKKVNVDGTMELLKLLTGNKKLKRIVVWGAGGVYGLPSKSSLPFKEDETLPNPRSDYILSKFHQELTVMNFSRKNGIPYTIIRPTTVYGPRGVYGSGSLIMTPATSPVVVVPACLKFRMPTIHVHDVCGAALFLAQSRDAEGEVFNVNDDSQMKVVEFFEFIASETGKKLVKIPVLNAKTLKFVATLAARGARLVSTYITHKPPSIEEDTVAYMDEDFVYSNEKLKSLGYKFIYPDVRDGVRNTLKWYQENGWI
jgi:nucleoside-diphosphate-sugar epimerase